jgi:DNA-directed RNA polymerase specialized sigma24 family protein
VNHEHPDFDASVQRLLDSATGADSETSADSRDVLVVTSSLARLLVARHRDLRDPDDTASEAVARFVEAAHAGRLETQARPAAYLTRIALNAAVDRLRQEGRVDVVAEVESDEAASDEEAIVRLLDSEATCQRVSDGISEANQAEDHVVVLVVTHWIDLAQSLSRAPTTREVAALAGLSHFTVAAALRRFRGYLPDGDANP